MSFLVLLVFLSQAQSSPQSPAIAIRLVDADIDVRANASVELQRSAAADPLVLNDQDIQRALVSLLERENARIAQNMAAFLGSGKSTLDESYAEYYSIVLGLANAVRKQGNPDATLAARLRRALIFGTYNPDSRFVDDLARDGEPLVPLIIELSKNPSGPMKWNAFGLAGALFAHAATNSLHNPLTPSSAARLRSVARNGLLDPAPDVRMWAVSAVSKARDQEAIPLLERLATSDPDAGPSKYSVRSVAAEALRQIR